MRKGKNWVTAVVPDTLKFWLDLFAVFMGCSRSELISKILHNFVAKNSTLFLEFLAREYQNLSIPFEELRRMSDEIGKPESLPGLPDDVVLTDLDLPGLKRLE